MKNDSNKFFFPSSSAFGKKNLPTTNKATTTILFCISGANRTQPRQLQQRHQIDLTGFSEMEGRFSFMARFFLEW